MVNCCNYGTCRTFILSINTYCLSTFVPLKYSLPSSDLALGRYFSKLQALFCFHLVWTQCSGSLLITVQSPKISRSQCVHCACPRNNNWIFVRTEVQHCTTEGVMSQLCLPSSSLIFSSSLWTVSCNKFHVHVCAKQSSLEISADSVGSCIFSGSLANDSKYSGAFPDKISCIFISTCLTHSL